MGGELRLCDCSGTVVLSNLALTSIFLNKINNVAVGIIKIIGIRLTAIFHLEFP